MTLPTLQSGPPGSDPWWAMFISKEGIAVAISAFLVWFLAWSLSGKVDTISAQITTHVSDSLFYSHQLCVITAKQAGEPIELCENKH